MTVKFAYVVQPWRGWRNTDKYGSGHYGASRDGGSRIHLGADAITVPGDPIYSPINGRVERLGICYAGDIYRLIELVGTGEHQSVRVRLLYVEPACQPGDIVQAGQHIGTAQDIGRRYPDITCHVHVETIIYEDPARFMP